MKLKLTQRKRVKNFIILTLHNNKSEIKQLSLKVETTMMLAVIHHHNSTRHLKCYSVVYPLEH